MPRCTCTATTMSGRPFGTFSAKVGSSRPGRPDRGLVPLPPGTAGGEDNNGLVHRRDDRDGGTFSELGGARRTTVALEDGPQVLVQDPKVKEPAQPPM